MDSLPSDPDLAEELMQGLLDVALLAREATGRTLRQEIVERGRTLFAADSAALWRLESRERIWRIAAGSHLSEKFAATVVPAMQQDLSAIVPAPLLVSNIEEWPHADARRALYSGEGIVSILLLPLTIRGESTGTLACYYRKRRTSLSALDSKAAAAFAEIASMTLSNERFGQLADVARDVALSVDLEAIVQKITDAATSLTGAKFGAFFYNVINDQGEAYTLYTISGISRDRFAGFPMPRNTAVFTPTFEGTGIVRSPNITKDARYGRTAPYHGMPEGHLPVVSYLAVPVKSRNGEVLGGLFFGDDAENVFGETEEKLAEALASHAAVAIDNFRLYERIQRDRAAARRQERRYRSLAMATPTRQAIVLSNAAGEVIEDSPSWREITGQTTSQMLGGGWIEAIHPRHRREVAERAAAALASRSVFEDRYLLRQTNGSYRWFADKTVPVFGESGEIEEWITTVIDVHEEQASQQMIEFLARASEVFASSLDHRETLRNLAFLVVPNFADWCAVDLATPAGPKEWERIAVAHSDPEKLALAEEFQRRFPPDPSTSPVYRVIRSGKSELLPFASEEMLRAAARSEEHYSLIDAMGIMSFMVVPLRARDEVVGAISFVASDRRYSESDLKRAEELASRASAAVENARLYTAAQAANRAKDELLATLSHELRTPMTAVLGWSRMLKLGLSEEDARIAVDAIEQSATAQAQLIEDVLDVSRIMAGKLMFDPRPTDLRVVAQAALTTVHPAAVAKGIEVLTSIPPALPPVAGDEGRLQQVVWNLLANAIKFTPRGGSVTLRLVHTGSTVRLTITDTGEGIDRSFLPFIFEAFRQADSSPSRAHGGIGLGLAIVRSLVEMHGGRITAASEGKGHGATFTLELPAMEVSPALVAPPRAEHGGIPPASDALPSLDRLRVLVVDDQEHAREVAAAILRRSGAVVETASSVREGLDLFERESPHVVVCDIAMPGEDGFAFVREVRLLSGPERTTPILALTAFGRPEDRLQALQNGFDAYLKKPVDPAELATAIQKLALRT